jgi:2-methylisocitrate lyase-like PEP mutase family enzyme
MTTDDPGAAFRALHRPGDPFVLANAWDRGTARLLAGLGAPAIATTSAGFAFTLGLPDGARISRDQALAHAADLAAAVPVPVSADLENGYADDPEDVAETIRLAGDAGLAGASIEDIALPAEDAYPRGLAVERIRAAVAAARALPGDFVLTARADGLLTAAYDLDEALARIRAFAEAGADCLYVPGLADAAALRAVCAVTPLPVNALATGAFVNLPRAEFGKLGVARISLGSGLARLSQAAVVEAAQAALGGDFAPLGWAATGAVIDPLVAKGAARGPGTPT